MPSIVILRLVSAAAESCVLVSVLSRALSRRVVVLSGLPCRGLSCRVVVLSGLPCRGLSCRDLSCRSQESGG